MREMVKSHRSFYAARVASDLVLNIRDRCIESGRFGCWVYLPHMTVVGFSLGAHVASQLCNNLYKQTGQKVGKLIGMDPAGVYLTLRGSNQTFINRGDATYVQIIHTDTILFGTVLPCGDVDIYVKDIPFGYSQKHSFGPYLHMATAIKKLIVIGERDGKRPWAHVNGKVILVDGNSTETDRVPKEGEVFLGVYSELEESKRGQQFYISLRDRIDRLDKSIVHVVKMFKSGSI